MEGETLTDGEDVTPVQYKKIVVGKCSSGSVASVCFACLFVVKARYDVRKSNNDYCQMLLIWFEIISLRF